jgi:hypothetical protein
MQQIRDEAGSDVTISMERANLLALPILPAVAAVTLLPFWAIWGWDSLANGFGDLVSWILIPAFLAAIVAHEGLHAIGFLLFGRAPRRSVHFGIHTATLTPFAGCHESITASAYRGAVALPGLMLGALPWLAGMMTGVGWLAAWGMVMTATAAGDLLVLWVIRDVPGRVLVLDHPERVGCRILA